MVGTRGDYFNQSIRKIPSIYSKNIGSELLPHPHHEHVCYALITSKANHCNYSNQSSVERRLKFIVASKNTDFDTTKNINWMEKSRNSHINWYKILNDVLDLYPGYSKRFFWGHQDISLLCNVINAQTVKN